MEIYLIMKRNLETCEDSIFAVFQSLANAEYDKSVAEKYNTEQEYTYWIEAHRIQDWEK